MSLAAPSRPRASAPDARAGLVDALNAAGLNALPAAPDTPAERAAWPQWVITNFNGHVCDPARHTYDAYVVLNAAEAAATVADADDVTASVAPHLDRVGVVQSVEPVLITFGDGTTMPGVRFRVITRA